MERATVTLDATLLADPTTLEPGDKKLVEDTLAEVTKHKKAADRAKDDAQVVRGRTI